MRVAILLAAGCSRRFGRANKLLAALGGKPVLLHALARVRESGARRIIVVTGADRGRVRRLLGGERIVHAPDHRDGLGASLRAGLRAVRPIEREVLLFLGDMPFARAPALRLRPGLDAMRAAWGRTPGHPVLMRTAAARRIGPGERGLAGSGRARIGLMSGGPGNLFDIDDHAGLRRARSLAARSAFSGRWKR